ncbi:hypothetical protein Tco_0746142, partial [Tanacetum coccineum]
MASPESSDITNSLEDSRGSISFLAIIEKVRRKERDASAKLTQAKLNKRSEDANLSKDKSGPELPLELWRSWYVKGHIRSRVSSSVLMQRYQRTLRQRGHNTNDCYHLKKQIEEAVTSEKLAHLVKDIRQGNQRNRGQGRRNVKANRGNAEFMERNAVASAYETNVKDKRACHTAKPNHPQSKTQKRAYGFRRILRGRDGKRKS